MSSINGEQLFYAYFDSVYQYIRFRVGHTQDAEDLTAEVFEKIAKNLHQYKNNEEQQFEVGYLLLHVMCLLITTAKNEKTLLI